MKWEKQVLDNRQDLDKNQIRQMVMESYHDIAAGKGHDYSDFSMNWNDSRAKIMGNT